MNNSTHHAIREAIRARIVAGEWDLGELIPGEVEFAAEYGCARTTVNRALQRLAEEGVVERKRKTGTRVLPLPLPLAQIRIPIIRQQVEAQGNSYTHQIINRGIERAPSSIRQAMRLDGHCRTARLKTLHLADAMPYAFEDRWVNLEVVPGFEDARLDQISANEWLLKTVPFSRGEVALAAQSADAQLAKLLQVSTGDALFTMERTTWLDDHPVTTMRLYYHKSYRLEFDI